MRKGQSTVRHKPEPMEEGDAGVRTQPSSALVRGSQHV